MLRFMVHAWTHGKALGRSEESARPTAGHARLPRDDTLDTSTVQSIGALSSRLYANFVKCDGNSTDQSEPE